MVFLGIVDDCVCGISVYRVFVLIQKYAVELHVTCIELVESLRCCNPEFVIFMFFNSIHVLEKQTSVFTFNGKVLEFLSVEKSK